MKWHDQCQGLIVVNVTQVTIYTDKGNQFFD